MVCENEMKYKLQKKKKNEIHITKKKNVKY